MQQSSLHQAVLILRISGCLEKAHSMCVDPAPLYKRLAYEQIRCPISHLLPWGKGYSPCALTAPPRDRCAVVPVTHGRLSDGDSLGTLLVAACAFVGQVAGPHDLLLGCLWLLAAGCLHRIVASFLVNMTSSDKFLDMFTIQTHTILHAHLYICTTRQQGGPVFEPLISLSVLLM